MAKPDSASAATSPSRNDGLTRVCLVCGHTFAPVGRRRFCTDACRQTAWRWRHPVPLATVPPRPPRTAVVYECPACAARYLGAQRCADCQRFCRRIGPGGTCPHCDEPVAIVDLISTEGR